MFSHTHRYSAHKLSRQYHSVVIYFCRYTFKQHNKSHEGEKCFKCDLCPYASTSARHLESHMLVHTEQKPYQCDQCDQVRRNAGEEDLRNVGEEMKDDDRERKRRDGRRKRKEIRGGGAVLEIQGKEGGVGDEKDEGGTMGKKKEGFVIL